MQNKRRNLTRWVVVPVLYLGAWQIVSMLVHKTLLLPGPVETLGRFLRLLVEGENWALAGTTLLRILQGYAAGVAGGVLLAVLTAASPFADAVLTPLRGIVKATPVTSFILLAILWMSSGMVPAFISFLMVLPIVWATTCTAIQNTDVQLLEMARAFGFSRMETVARVYAPSVKPQFLAACTTALGFAWKSGVAAEIIALPKRSIGYQLYVSKLTLESVDLFAWTLLVILLSMALERLLVGAMRRIGK